MPLLYGVFIGAAILSLWWSLTTRPSAARANLFAGLPGDTKPQATGVTRTLGTLGQRIVPRGLLDSLEQRLVQAGHPGGLDVNRFLGVKLFVALLLSIFPLLFHMPLLVLVTLPVGFFAPDYWLATAKEQRQTQIRDGAADMLDQLVICVEAGLGFDAALQRVSSTLEGALATELQHTVQDMQAGVPRDQALKALAERTQIPEIKQLVQALIQAQRYGVSLADTLRLQADEMRDKRKQRMEEKAAKMATKLIFPVVLCFMPVFFIIILTPSIAGLSHVL